MVYRLACTGTYLQGGNPCGKRHDAPCLAEHGQARGIFTLGMEAKHMTDIYIKLPKLVPDCGHCIWLEKAHNDAVEEDIAIIALLSRQAMILHLIEAHGGDEQAALPW